MSLQMPRQGFVCLSFLWESHMLRWREVLNYAGARLT